MEMEELKVKIVDRCLVPPCLPSPRETLYLSNIDNQPVTRTFFSTLLVYENLGCQKNLAYPAKTIREALSKVLVYYYPLAGRLRKKGDGRLQMESTGEGVLFAEAMVNNTLSALGDLDHLKPSFKHLLFTFPPDTDIEETHPLAIQVNHFACGGFVVAVTFYHGVCDGKGLGQFLKGLGEMARGYDMPYVKPIWDRELFKSKKLMDRDLDMIEGKRGSTSNLCTSPIFEELVQTSLMLDLNTIKCMKQEIMQECGESCTTFEIVAALVWRAMTRTLEIPYTQCTNAFFAIDVREKIDPPLPNGYYGNGIIVECAKTTIFELMSKPLSYAVNSIKKTKMSITNEYLRSIVDLNQFPCDILGKQCNIALSDWRWLGFNEVDFGSGCPINVCPMNWIENGLNSSNAFIFLPPSKEKVDKFKMITWMQPQKFKVFEIEVEAIINKYLEKKKVT